MSTGILVYLCAQLLFTAVFAAVYAEPGKRKNGAKVPGIGIRVIIALIMPGAAIVATICDHATYQATKASVTK